MTKPLAQLAKPRILQDSLVENAKEPGSFLPTIEAIVQAVRGGHTHADAALWAGVMPPTLSQWLRRGAMALTEQETAAAADPDAPPPEIPESERPYAELAGEVLRADALHRMKVVGQINAAVPKDWHAGVEVLRAKERGSWCPPNRVEVTGAGGGPVQGSVSHRWDHADARQFEATLKSRAAEQGALTVGEAGDE